MHTLDLQKFRVIRFMDWQKTNNSQVVHYNDLPVAHKSWTFKGGRWNSFKGVPLSVIIDVANDMQAQPWICIPHRATDDCIRRIVSLVVSRANFRPIFEYSNEIWNGQFQQFTYCFMHGMWKRMAFRPLSAALAWQAHRTSFLADAVCGRGDIVVSGQAANDWIAKQVLQNPVLAGKVDAVAIAPYFGQFSNKLAWGNWNSLYDGLQHEIDTTVRTNIKQHKKLADQFGVQLWGYEGGQHLLGRNKEQTSQFVKLNRDERMGRLTQQWLNTWYDEGGSLMCPYSTSSDFGSHCWGYVEIENGEYIKRPKYQALLATEPVAAPAPSAGMPVPAGELVPAGGPY
ncbi:MAG: hypothetical protein ACPG8W_18690 [Candidatus Promineifilaceae bacterium]